MKNLSNIINKNFIEHRELLEVCKKNLNRSIVKAVEIITNSIKKNNLILWCGNGGSASDSMHYSSEFIGRYKNNRRPLRSISLSSDQAAITCIANDFGYEKIFSRQVEGLGKAGDVLVCLTTSGNSKNIINAIKSAKKKKLQTLLISGNKGGKCAKLCSHKILIPSSTTSRIQEMQLIIGHLIIELVEKKLDI
jgi:D-sedoheptulose 7-phosphate isomerase